jgi:RES domain
MSPQLPSTLPTVIIHPDRSLYRLNRANKERSQYFGGNEPLCRFDDPNLDDRYGVMYAGEDAGVCFLETISRNNTISAFIAQGIDETTYKKCSVDKAKIEQYNLFLIVARKSLVFADLSAMDGSPTTGNEIPYPECQQWSRLIWEHPSNVAGIRYKSWQDRDKYSYAIFDRATEFQSIRLGNLLEQNNIDLLKSIMEKYDIELIESLKSITPKSVLFSVETKI